ncbi:MAG: SpoIIE family protein phosphatase [Acutalibacteraceae bacterium]|nr:SpoIIE family protein phosphatase [Acutalibacteraceae bacterium]
MNDESFKTKYSEFISFSSIRIFLIICGFLMSRSVLFDEFVPFGLALVAGTPVKFCIYSSIGAAAGYFIPATGYGMFKYLTAIIVMNVIRFAFSKFKISRLPSFNAIVALVCSLTLSLINEITIGADVVSVIKCFAEGLICSASAYFCSVAISFLSPKSKKPAANDMMCVVAFTGILLMSFYNIGYAGVSVARIMCVIIILCASYYGKEGAGAVAGTTLGFFMFLASNEISLIGVYGISGVVAGIFSSSGNVAVALSFIMTSLLNVFLNDYSLIAVSLFELLTSSAVFLLMPNKAQKILSNLFSPLPEIPLIDGLNKGVSLRLNFAAEALNDMGQTVENVSNRLKSVNTPEYKEIFDYSRNTVCHNCGFLKLCWVHKKEDMLLSLSQVSNGKLTTDKLSDKLVERCDKAQQLCDCVNSAYSVFSSKREAQARLDEVRGVLIDQFGGISDMLSEMAMDFEKSQRCDYETAQKIAGALAKIGIIAADVSCCVDKYNRMTIEIRLKNYQGLVNSKQLLTQMIAICEREFDVPCITSNEKDTLITISEKAVYSVDCGIYSINCSNNKMCGDSATEFNDGRGRQIMMLSDGMGTGGRAAVDSAMASALMSKLIKAGFGYDCSMKMVNSAMLFKSTDESLATLDITSLDLYTGKAEIYKAGACPTVIKRAGKSCKAECTSLPIGILKDAAFDTAKITLKEGDIIVMMSDGVTYDGVDWICEQLNMIKYPVKASVLAEKLATLAKRNRTDGHDDDVTVMVSIIEKAV